MSMYNPFTWGRSCEFGMGRLGSLIYMSGAHHLPTSMTTNTYIWLFQWLLPRLCDYPKVAHKIINTISRPCMYFIGKKRNRIQTTCLQQWFCIMVPHHIWVCNPTTSLRFMVKTNMALGHQVFMMIWNVYDVQGLTMTSHHTWQIMSYSW